MSDIEKAARAMFEHTPAFTATGPNARKHTWDDYPCNDLDPRKYWLSIAEAALAAVKHEQMREALKQLADAYDDASRTFDFAPMPILAAARSLLEE